MRGIRLIALTGAIAGVTLAGTSVIGAGLSGPALAATVRDTVEVPGTPTAVTVSPSGSQVYVANGRSVLAIDADTLQTAWTTPVASATDLATAPSGSRIYAGGGTRVVAIDAASGEILRTMSVKAGVEALAVTPDGRQVWALGPGPKAVPHGVITVLDAVSGRTVDTINVGPIPKDLVISPSGARAYVLGWGSDSVWVINAKSRTVMSKLKVRPWPEAMAVNPDGSRLLVSHSPPGVQRAYAVTTINTEQRAVTGVFRNPADLAAISVNQAELQVGTTALSAGRALVGITDDTELVVIDLATQQTAVVLDIRPACAGVLSLNGLALSPGTSRAYVTAECLGHPGTLTAVDLS